MVTYPARKAEVLPIVRKPPIAWVAIVLVYRSFRPEVLNVRLAVHIPDQLVITALVVLHLPKTPMNVVFVSMRLKVFRFRPS